MRNRKVWREFIITRKKPALITVLMGTAMSALSGIKDSFGDTMAISIARCTSCQTFEVNFPLVIRISVEETISRVRSGLLFYYWYSKIVLYLTMK